MNYDRLLNNLGDVRDALKLSTKETHRLHRQHLNPIVPWIVRFLGMNVPITQASGMYLKDVAGHQYLDFLGGFGALNFGHEPPEILDAIREIEGKPHLTHTFLSPLAGKLAEYLSEITPGDLSRAFFCNSGAEAVEAAIKLARAATSRKIIVHTTGAFHGKTLGALSVSGREKYKKPFEPLLPGTKNIPFGDAYALEQELKRGDVAAFIVEPIQGEGGVIVPPNGYLKNCESLCRRYETLLIVDEIQTGFGRTGRIFCCNHEQVEPDVMALSKSLSGGVIPLGAMVTTNRLWRKAYGSLEKSLLHTSTFSSNARACAAGIAAIRLLLEKRLEENAAKMGNLLIEQLRTLQKTHEVLKEVRGKGLLIGLSIRSKPQEPRGVSEGAITLWIARNLFKRYGIITGFALNNYNVLRVEPPLIINEEQVRYFIDSFDAVLAKLKRDFAMQLLQQLV